MAVVKKVNNTKESERSESLTNEISNAFGGIKTTLLINREKKEGNLDHFEPHNFLDKHHPASHS
ncbi:hypothetical protein OF83DRAFT_1180377 [Amylostereum chailletii]|nr:hypothetical protein OF83DRAFT_1180377 [Amylostereum chailletii]